MERNYIIGFHGLKQSVVDEVSNCIEIAIVELVKMESKMEIIRTSSRCLTILYSLTSLHH